MVRHAKQQAFVREYLLDHNATQAAIRAGYSAKTAYSQGQRLLKNVEVKAAIEKGQVATAQRLDIEKDRVLKDCLQIVETELRDVVEWDGKTLKVKSFEDIPGAVHPAIESIKQRVSKDGGSYLEIKLHDKMRAIAELNRMLGFYAAEKADLKVPILNVELHMNEPQKPGLG